MPKHSVGYWIKWQIGNKLYPPMVFYNKENIDRIAARCRVNHYPHSVGTVQRDRLLGEASCA